MKKGQVQILEQKKLSSDIFSMWIEEKEMTKEAKPGQFVSLFTGDKSKLLPRPISICEIDRAQGRLRLVYRKTGEGRGTDLLSQKVAGDKLEVMGPFGNGFPLFQGKKALLIGGGIGIPPMLELGKALKKDGNEVEFVLGFREELFLLEDLEQVGRVFVATESGTFGTKGNVLDCISSYGLSGDVICACGPTPMLKALEAYGEEAKIPCYLSLEERMACGIGACLACVCNSKEMDGHTHVKNKRICKEGPVFLGGEVDWI